MFENILRRMKGIKADQICICKHILEQIKYMYIPTCIILKWLLNLNAHNKLVKLVICTMYVYKFYLLPLNACFKNCH